jgi:hypothetical protein
METRADKYSTVSNRFVDTDPDWIMIQRLLWIRIRVQNSESGARIQIQGL